ncbi:mandelate racemase [Mesorhizobium sp. B2-7-3]|uniref:mandelate racemase/muconate lactonizing enzyme family protein n=1 Tax=Mesorhizobium sp. B2-7-3 TaxID=2589907 RepID=UPI001129ECEE|nr:enolase C-terminal domain-like protein [Mesorhizobium sp. B2-7-3]TPJ18896.1 mandelate racemase [Mesorhizobium sp. B2-7-3]
MKIAAVELYEYKLTYIHGTYAMSKGRAASQQPSNLVRVITDNGIEGWGEAAILSGNYLPLFAGGTRAALRELAPNLIGEDPCATRRIEAIMDSILMGQLNAKSAFDVACWDIFGKSVDMPIAALLGGVLSEDLPIFEAIPLASTEANIEFLRKRTKAGIRRFQLKVGDDPKRDAARVRAIIEAADDDVFLYVDANAGWTLLEASVGMRALEDLNLWFEQPCRELADCALLRKISPLPLIMDESVVNCGDLHQAKYEVGAAGINIKIGRVGGITRAASMRDTAQNLGLHFNIEDIWGGDVSAAAVSHVAASSRPSHLLQTSFFNDWTDGHVAGYQPRVRNGRGAAPSGPGLGITVDRSMIGDPVASFK